MPIVSILQAASWLLTCAPPTRSELLALITGPAIAGTVGALAWLAACGVQGRRAANDNHPRLAPRVASRYRPAPL